MNPYLEQTRGGQDLHQSFITAARAAIARPVRPRHGVHVEEHLFLHRPSNKSSGSDREQYLVKRKQLLRTEVHLVEIDLLRAGPRMSADGLPDCEDCVMVSRAERRPHVGIWPILLDDPLPLVPIPLSHGNPDADLDLKCILNRVYDEAGYGDFIDAGQPEPPLSAEQRTWADRLLAAR